MKRVKRNSDRQQNVEMRRLIDDSDARKEPLEILEQKIPVFEKPEHAQIHANAGHQPALLRAQIFRFANLAAEPEIHRRRREQKRSERRVPRAVKNVARNHEEIFPQFPAANTPVKSDNDYKKNDEGKRIEKHGEKFELCSRCRPLIYASHIGLMF